jgi:hypothetical protein
MLGSPATISNVTAASAKAAVLSAETGYSRLDARAGCDSMPNCPDPVARMIE